MLSKLSTVSRAALVKRVCSNAKFAAPQSALFHSSVPRKEEKKEAALPPSFAEKYHLNDWRVALPVGLFLGIPAIANEWYVLNEESQLAVCFMLFVGASYKFGKDAASDFFQKRRETMLREFNSLEDAQIDGLSEVLKEFSKYSKLENEVDLIFADIQKYVNDCAKARDLKAKHDLKAKIVGLLNDAVEAEGRFERKRLEKVTQNAEAAVIKSLAGGDKAFRRALMIEALNELVDPSTAAKDKVILSAYGSLIDEANKVIDEGLSKPITLTESTKKKIKAEYEVIARKYGVSVEELGAVPDVIDPKKKYSA